MRLIIFDFLAAISGDRASLMPGASDDYFCAFLGASVAVDSSFLFGAYVRAKSRDFIASPDSHPPFVPRRGSYGRALPSRVSAMECKYAATNRFYGYCRGSIEARVQSSSPSTCTRRAARETPARLSPREEPHEASYTVDGAHRCAFVGVSQPNRSDALPARGYRPL